MTFYQTRNLQAHCETAGALLVLYNSAACMGWGRIVQNSGGHVLMMLVDDFEPRANDTLGNFNFDAEGWYNQSVWIDGKSLEWHPCALTVFDTSANCCAIAFAIRNKNFEQAMRRGHVPASYIVRPDGRAAKPGDKLSCQGCGRILIDVTLE